MKAIKSACIIVLASLMLFLSACNLYGDPSSDTSGMVVSYLPSSGVDSAVSIYSVSALPFDGSLRLNLSAGADFIESVTWLGDNLLLIDSSSETVRDAFELYDFNSNTTTPIMLGTSDGVRYSFRTAFGHYILFEAESRWTSDETCVVDMAWIYDIDTKTAVQYTLKDYESKPKKGDILCSGFSNRVYYVNMASGTINAIYYLPNSGYSTAVSPDKSQIAYADNDGVYVSAPDFSNAKLLIKAKPENKENPTFSEGIGNIFWANNKTIGYSWYIDSNPSQCGFINSDGTGETLPEALKNMEFNTTPISDSKVFVYNYNEIFFKFGIYDLSGNWFDLKSELNGGFYRKIIAAPDGQRLIFKEEENITILTLNAELTAIEQKITLPEKTQQIHFFDNSISSDNRKLVYRIMGGNNKGVYVVDINSLG